MTTSASTSPDRPSTCGFAGGPPGIRTPNLRIKSPVRRCGSEGCTTSELRVCVPVVPIVSHRFPFLHGDETGQQVHWALSFSVLRSAWGRSRRGHRSGQVFPWG